VTPELSRRCGLALHSPPGNTLTLNERVEFEDRNDGAASLADLSPADRQLVEQGEKNRRSPAGRPATPTIPSTTKPSTPMAKEAKQ